MDALVTLLIWSWFSAAIAITDTDQNMTDFLWKGCDAICPYCKNTEFNAFWTECIFLVTNAIFFIFSFRLAERELYKIAIQFYLLGLVSLWFHFNQCITGGNTDDTKKSCFIDFATIIVTLVTILYYFGPNIKMIILGLLCYPVFMHAGKYYIWTHSLWHILGALSLYTATV